MKRVAGTVVTLLFIVLISMQAMADTNFKTYDGIEYVSNGEFITITGYSGYSRGVITIPDTLNGLPVTDIGDEVFASLHHPTGIVLPDSIINIGAEAFMNMFAAFDLGNSVKSIGDYAFRMNTVLRITLPDSVESIGQGAFYDSYGLERIVIPLGVTQIKAETFQRCPALSMIVFLNPDTEIDTLAFDAPEDSTLVIYGHVGSKVEKFANDNGYAFKPYIPININGKEITPVNAIPEIVGEDIFVPLGFVVEALHHTVDYWESDEDEEIWIDGSAFSHIIGTDYLRWVGGDMVEPKLTNKSYINNGVTMVSPDFIQQSIGCEVIWDKASNTIEITANDNISVADTEVTVMLFGEYIKFDIPPYELDGCVYVPFQPLLTQAGFIFPEAYGSTDSGSVTCYLENVVLDIPYDDVLSKLNGEDYYAHGLSVTKTELADMLIIPYADNVFEVYNVYLVYYSDTKTLVITDYFKDIHGVKVNRPFPEGVVVMMETFFEAIAASDMDLFISVVQCEIEDSSEYDENGEYYMLRRYLRNQGVRYTLERIEAYQTSIEALNVGGYFIEAHAIDEDGQPFVITAIGVHRNNLTGDWEIYDFD